MIDGPEAERIVLALVHGDDEDEFVVTSCALSEGGDYWVVTANSRAWVEGGDEAARSVGVNAYLVPVRGGPVETVGSGEQVEDWLEEKRNAALAEQGIWTLECDSPLDNPGAVLRIREALGCDVGHALAMTRGEGRRWLWGDRGALETASDLLDSVGVRARVTLVHEPPGTVPRLEGATTAWDALARALSQRR